MYGPVIRRTVVGAPGVSLAVEVFSTGGLGERPSPTGRERPLLALPDGCRRIQAADGVATASEGPGWRQRIRLVHVGVDRWLSPSVSGSHPARLGHACRQLVAKVFANLLFLGEH